METYATDHGGSYLSADPAALNTIEQTLKTSGTNAITVPTAAAGNYAVASTSSTGNVFTITRATTGVVTFSCTTAGSAGCPTGGDWSN
jgi:hypothetical protein